MVVPARIINEQPRYLFSVFERIIEEVWIYHKISRTRKALHVSIYLHWYGSNGKSIEKSEEEEEKKSPIQRLYDGLQNLVLQRADFIRVRFSLSLKQ